MKRTSTIQFTFKFSLQTLNRTTTLTPFIEELSEVMTTVKPVITAWSAVYGTFTALHKVHIKIRRELYPQTNGADFYVFLACWCSQGGY